MNPVKAGLAATPEAWRWSSARAHLAGRDDGVASVAPLLSRIADFGVLLASEPDAAATVALERAATVGRPLGAEAWVRELEHRTGQTLVPRKRGPKPKPAELFSKLSP
jgi:putative transposase